MGSRRARKRERRAERRRDGGAQPLPFDLPLTADRDLLDLLAAEREERPPSLRTCIECTEFVEDELSSRGSCLHPGSGIVSPWTDTPACPFFSARRRPLRTASW